MDGMRQKDPKPQLDHIPSMTWKWWAEARSTAVRAARTMRAALAFICPSTDLSLDRIPKAQAVLLCLVLNPSIPPTQQPSSSCRHQ